jgi:hypothetical protein
VNSTPLLPSHNRYTCLSIDEISESSADEPDCGMALEPEPRGTPTGTPKKDNSQHDETATVELSSLLDSITKLRQILINAPRPENLAKSTCSMPIVDIVTAQELITSISQHARHLTSVITLHTKIDRLMAHLKQEETISCHKTPVLTHTCSHIDSNNGTSTQATLHTTTQKLWRSPQYACTVMQHGQIV